MASAAIVGSTLALNSPVTTSAARDVNHTIATGSPAGAVIAQPTSLGSGGAVTIVPSEPSGGQITPLKPLSRVQPASPPLMSTPGTRAETMITLATRPSGHTPAPQAGAAPAKSATARTSATLEVPSSLNIGAGSSGQITITAVGGSVHWSATASAPVSLSQSSGTVAPGQPVTLTVTVDRGPDAGSADVSIALPDSAPQAISVIWSAQPASVGRGPGPGAGSGQNSGSDDSTVTGSGRHGRSGTSGASGASGTLGTSGGQLRHRPQGTASASAPASSTAGS
jgi:hypothetical protein